LVRLLDQSPGTPHSVDRRVACGGRDPGAGVARDPLLGPYLERLREGVLHRLLGEVEVAEDTDQRRDRPTRFLTEQAIDGGVVVAPVVRQPNWFITSGALKSTIGRTSIEPNFAPGHAPPSCSASSRSFASIR